MGYVEDLMEHAKRGHRSGPIPDETPDASTDYFGALRDVMDKRMEDARIEVMRSVPWTGGETSDPEELRRTIRRESEALIVATDGDGRETVFAALAIGIRFAQLHPNVVPLFMGLLEEKDNYELADASAHRLAAGEKANAAAVARYIAAQEYVPGSLTVTRNGEDVDA